ncbi:unnamed protein product [Pleuronectes platessa]|uniref:Uncharacterized protein n=1 Tax=Pleuronectes platessa TaxID=8262 RepID=A0A9N7VMN6_PLEPL|nr:unnamed protein product [Pleuronectes platessa]
MVSTGGLGSGVPTSIWPKQRKRNSTACPAHCAKERQPSDSAEEDDGGGGGGASMLGRAALEGIHLVRDTGRDWRGGERVERQPRQTELLLLHCRTASDVEPTLGAGERAERIGHVSRLPLATVIGTSCLKCHASSLASLPSSLPLARCPVPRSAELPLAGPHSDFSSVRLGSMAVAAAARRRAQPHKANL